MPLKPSQNRRSTLATIGAAMLAGATLLAAPMAAAQGTERLAFSGGPDGGTFQFFSNGLATLLSRSMPNTSVSNMASAGSVENLRRVNNKDADFGIVYSGDLFLGMNGKLDGDNRQYRNVHVLSYLLGAPAHLIVLDNSGIKDVADLAGKQVAVGPAGSGAAASAQRFFESINMWDKIKPQYIGYSQGAAAIGDKQIDALWVFAGYPNASVTQAAASNNIRLLQVHAAAAKGSLAKDHPYYAKVTIPKGTYKGVDYDVVTVQDSALWVAGRHVKEDTIHKALSAAYSEDGLKFMHATSKAATGMTVASGLDGAVTPVHKGAQKFWKEKGKTIARNQE